MALRAPELMIRPLMVLLLVAPVMAPLRPIVLIPVRAPVLETFRLPLEVNWNVPVLLPSVRLPVPVAILVAAAPLGFMLVVPVREMVPPEAVRPPLRVVRPETLSALVKVLSPSKLWAEILTRPG